MSSALSSELASFALKKYTVLYCICYLYYDICYYELHTTMMRHRLLHLFERRRPAVRGAHEISGVRIAIHLVAHPTNNGSGRDLQEIVRGEGCHVSCIVVHQAVEVAHERHHVRVVPAMPRKLPVLFRVLHDHMALGLVPRLPIAHNSDDLSGHGRLVLLVGIVWKWLISSNIVTTTEEMRRSTKNYDFPRGCKQIVLCYSP